MRDLTKLPHGLDRDAGVCNAVVETPKGHRSKYNFDPETGLFELHTLLPEGMTFPLDFGFVPSTLCDDGDPLDIMILSDEPATVGALVRVRLVGVLEAEEKEKGQTERNDRLLAIPLVSYLYSGIRGPEDFEPSFVSHLADFWVNKARLEDKVFKVLNVGGPEAAIALLRRSAKTAKRAA